MLDIIIKCSNEFCDLIFVIFAAENIAMENRLCAMQKQTSHAEICHEIVYYHKL